MSSIAIIGTGGKQYLIKSGDKLQVEKLGVGSEKWEFDKVLLIADENSIKIGKPYLEGIKIPAEILEQKRLKKITILRYHSKTRHRRKKGHRQNVTQVKIGNW